MATDLLAKEQLNKYESARSKRSATFDSDWQTISQYFLPQESDINVTKTEGITGWTDRIFDTTAILAAQTMAAGQRNWLTPSSEPWAQFEPPMPLRQEGDDAAIWLGRCSDITMQELARSNFYSVVNIGYLHVGIFGTDCIFCEEGKSSSLNFRNTKVGTYTIEENDEGIVDTVRREFKLTGRQAIQMFGEESLPEKMQNALKGGKGMDRDYKFVHAVFPREDSSRLPERQDGANKPIASVYISVDFSQCVRVSGYDEMPYLCSRFSKWGTDAPWGYSPAYLALPDVRQINYITQYTDALAELKAYPRILVPSNLDGDVDLRAGGVTTWDINEPNGRPVEWATIGDYKMGMELIANKKEMINDAFFVNMFKMLGSDPLIDKKMTAYEISQRLAEKLEQFTPVFDRRVTEFLNPLLRRVFGILYRQGKFGQAPDSLMVDSGVNSKGLVLPEITITSRISLALKALQNRGTEQAMQFLQPIMQFKPEVADNFDLDKMMRNYAMNSGMNADLFRDERSVAAIRQQRMKLQQQQQALQAAEQLGKAGKGLGGSPDFVQYAAKNAMQQ